jgi:hypothetical protein
MSSFLNNHVVRGLRNNNPGNLIRTANAWQGKLSYKDSKDEKFEQFIDIKHGVRAMIKDLINDISKGKNTVKKLIYEYAPPNENNTQMYINSVSKSIGIKEDEIIKTVNNEFLTLLSRAIMKVELGKSHTLVTDSDINDALQILGHASTKNVMVQISTVNEKLKPLYPVLGFIAFFFSAKMVQQIKTQFKK